MDYRDGLRPRAIAHRGGAALGPENTIAAFGLASALGLRYLETDLQVTSDGQAVCFHDHDLTRTTGAKGPVRSRTLAEVRRLRVHGVGLIPTLEEVLDAFPEQCFTVDLKDRAAIDPLVSSLRRTRAAGRVCVAGAWDGWLGHVRRELPAVTTALGWWSLSALLTCARTGVRPPRALATAPYAHVPVRLGGIAVFADRLVGMSHEIGVEVVTWTVDDPAVMRTLLDAGVDAIITDRPDVLREVLISRRQWSPMTAPMDTEPTSAE